MNLDKKRYLLDAIYPLLHQTLPAAKSTPNDGMIKAEDEEEGETLFGNLFGQNTNDIS